MPETIIHKTERPDSISIGREARGGIIKVYFDSGDLPDAEKRIDNIVKAREYLVTKLAGSGIT